jgi:cytochrome c556
MARGNERVSFTCGSVMRWLRVWAWVLCAGSAGLAQVVFTVDDLDKAMKAVGRNVGLANAAIGSKDFEGAKVRVARAREQLSPTVSFWTNEKKADAVKLVRAATARLDALDRALSANPVDASAVAGAAMELDAACQACHAVYREQDAATKMFRLKRVP